MVDWDGCPPERWGDFCVVDGARSPDIYGMATRSREEWACLYDGRLPPALLPVAPYLVRLHIGSHFTRLFYAKGWGQAWGLVIRSNASLTAMRRHLRTLNYVSSSKHRKLLFRFYDPRVLRIFLPTCSVEQLDTLFGPIEAIVLEGKEDSQVLTYHRDEWVGKARGCP
jgi:hypothetical protein